MLTNPSRLRVSIFYSYSHKDIQHREDMERTLSLLRERAFLRDWSDERILPGQSISEATRTKQSEADVVAFLFSPDFLASKECRREWDRATKAASAGQLLFRVPIIVRPCGWYDFLGEDDVKALPRDGKANHRIRQP